MAISLQHAQFSNVRRRQGLEGPMRCPTQTACAQVIGELGRVGGSCDTDDLSVIDPRPTEIAQENIKAGCFQDFRDIFDVIDI